MKKELRTMEMVQMLALAALILIGAHRALAQTATSSHFAIPSATADSYGGVSTSTSFSSVNSGDQIASGHSTSTSFLLDSGFMYYDTFTPKQQNWRWYDDYTNETPSSALASENVAPSSVADQTVLKLRVTVKEAGGYGADGPKFKLQFATSSDFSSGAYDVVEAGNCTGTSQWCYADGGGVDNALITTNILSDSDSCAASVGTGCGTHNESGISTSSASQAANAATEYEFTIIESGPWPNTVYFFRLFEVGSGIGVPLNTGKSYPSISSSGTTLSFTIDGLASSTVTSGITTSVDATPTAVPFGTLPLSSAQTAAQRLTVTTNASQGYEVFAYGQQDLVGSSNDTIPPVLGTNQSPTGWSSGCLSTLTGCYGYHTNESVLSGGSTRFAADDTYAQFSTTSLSEVAYSSGATTTKSTDIVYKVEVHDLQAADSYSTSIVYIVVPTF